MQSADCILSPMLSADCAGSQIACNRDMHIVHCCVTISLLEIVHGSSTTVYLILHTSTSGVWYPYTLLADLKYNERFPLLKISFFEVGWRSILTPTYCEVIRSNVFYFQLHTLNDCFIAANLLIFFSHA